MSSNKLIITPILTMVVIYLMIAFIAWDLNAKHWEPLIRAIYAIGGTIFSALVYFGIKIEINEQQ